jgi:hypothetical protein
MSAASNFPWDSQRVQDRTRNLIAAGRSGSEIAKILTREFDAEPPITRDVVNSRIRQLRKDIANAAVVLPSANPTPVFSAIMARPKAKHKPSLASLIRGLERQDEVKALIISDTHGRMCDEAALAWAIELGADADVIFVLGDITDWSSKSLKYPALTHVSGESEIEGSARTLAMLEATGKPVVCLFANHDARPGRAFRALMPSEFLFLFEDDLTTYIADRSSNIWTTGDFVRGWKLQFGDALLAHGEVTGPGYGGPVAALFDVLRNRARDFSIRGELKAVFSGHFHFGSVSYRNEVALVNVPCLQETPDYSLTGQGAKYRLPTMIGAVTASWRKGKIQPASVSLAIYPRPEWASSKRVD